MSEYASRLHRFRPERALAQLGVRQRTRLTWDPAQSAFGASVSHDVQR